MWKEMDHLILTYSPLILTYSIYSSDWLILRTHSLFFYSFTLLNFTYFTLSLSYSLYSLPLLTLLTHFLYLLTLHTYFILLFTHTLYWLTIFSPLAHSPDSLYVTHSYSLFTHLTDSLYGLIWFTVSLHWIHFLLIDSLHKFYSPTKFTD